MSGAERVIDLARLQVSSARRRRRVLVTGAGGFVGSHLCEALVARGFDVVGLEGFIDSYGRDVKESNLTALEGHPSFRRVDADLATADLGPVLDGVDTVVNEAAIAGLPRSWADIGSYTRNNIEALQRLLEASRRAGVRRFVQASTSSVYGRVATGDESSPTRPVSPYGVTKLAGEHLAGAYFEDFGLPVVILRYFSIYGPRQRPDMGYHIFIDRMLRDLPLTVFGDGLQSRSNTFVDDCVRATVLALEHARDGEVYNVGGGAALTLNDAIATISELVGVVPRIDHRPERPGDQRHTFADIGKARRELGYDPAVTPRDGLAAQVAWQRSRAAARVDA